MLVSLRKPLASLPRVSPVTKIVRSARSGHRAAKLAPQPRAVEVGHAQIADDHVECCSLEMDQSLAPAARHRHIVALAAQHLANELGDLRFVVDDENACQCGRLGIVLDRRSDGRRLRVSGKTI